MYVYTNKVLCLYKSKFSYNCMHTQRKTHADKTISTHITVCIHKYNYSNKCMFTQI